MNDHTITSALERFIFKNWAGKDLCEQIPVSGNDLAQLLEETSSKYTLHGCYVKGNPLIDWCDCDNINHLHSRTSICPLKSASTG